MDCGGFFMISNKLINSINIKIFQLLGVFLFFILFEFLRVTFNNLSNKLLFLSNSDVIICIFLYILLFCIAINFIMFILSDRNNKYTTTLFIVLISLCISYLFGEKHLKAYQGDILSDFFDNSFYVSVLLIVFYLAIHIIFIIKQWSNERKKRSIEDSPYYNLSTEKAISTFKEDAFGRKEFAENISTLINEQSSESLTVGIYGKWGSGKSSILNLIRENLEQNKEKSIIVNFTPWYFESASNDLIIRFFEQLFTALNKDRGINTDLKKYLNDYIKLFAAISIRPAGLIINFKEIISKEEKDLYKLKKAIEQEFNSISKKIVVFIDELDRLDNEEIKLIFKLIRLIGDFPNTTYLIGIDEDKISKSLGASLNKGNKEVEDYDFGKEYLEKFIQVPIYLPRIENRSIVDFIKIKLSTTFDEEQLKEIDTQLLVDNIVSQDLSVRNIIRYFNLVSFFSNVLKDEINLNDLLLLLIIKIKNIKLFNFISSNPNYFTERVDSKILEKNKLELQEMQDALNQFKPVLLELSSYSSQLFNGELIRSNNNRKNGISDKENFVKYFKYGVPEGVLSVGEVKIFLNNLITLDEAKLEGDLKNLRESYFLQDINKLIEQNIDVVVESEKGLFKLYKLMIAEYNKELTDIQKRSIIDILSLCIEKNYNDQYLNYLLKINNIAIAYRVKDRIRRSNTLNDNIKLDFATNVEDHFDPHINNEILNNTEISDDDKQMVILEWIKKETQNDIDLVRQRINSMLETPSHLNQIIGILLYNISDDVLDEEFMTISYYSRIVEIIDWDKLNKLMYANKYTESYINIDFVKKIEEKAYKIITRNLKDIFEVIDRKAIDSDFELRYYFEYIIIYERGNQEIVKEWNNYMEIPM